MSYCSVAVGTCPNDFLNILRGQRRANFVAVVMCLNALLSAPPVYPNEAKVMNVENLPPFQVRCDRDDVEDATVRRLAGIEPYPEAEIRRAKALTQIPAADLQAMLASQ